jgi:hypothetical protein
VDAVRQTLETAHDARNSRGEKCDLLSLPDLCRPRRPSATRTGQ